MNYSDFSQLCESKVYTVLEQTQCLMRELLKDRLDSLAGCAVRSVDEACELMYAVDRYAFLSFVRDFENSYHNRLEFAIDFCIEIGADSVPASLNHILSRCYCLSSDCLDLEFRSAVTDLLDFLP